ncbi:MAG TPA: hypothetical protein VFD33_08020, partial [Bacillota bacterium]|nr:hypothetical protein [Bacillota bacterium]
DKTDYTIAISYDDPDAAVLIAQALYENYIKYVDTVVRDRTLLYYYDRFTAGIESSQISLSYENESLKNNLELLEGMQKFINIDDILDTIPDIGEVMIIESISNPEYEKLQEDILIKKQTINNLENTIRQNKDNIGHIRAEKEVINGYYETGVLDKQKTTIINVVERHIYQLNSATSGRKTGPRHVENIMVGAILGFVISSAGVLAIHFLRKE